MTKSVVLNLFPPAAHFGTFLKFVAHFISFYLYIYPCDSLESDGAAIYRASNYPDLH